VSETDAAIEHYFSLKPIQFDRLIRFELKLILQPGWDVWDATYTLTIELKQAPGSSASLLLTFRGVRQLDFLPAELLIIPVELDIRCVRDPERENVKYRVWNLEQDTDLTFTCEFFEAKVVDDASEAP